MNLVIDPAKAYAANPEAAKKYGLKKPTTTTSSPYVSAQGLATYQAAQAAGKTYVPGKGYTYPTAEDVYAQRKREATYATQQLKATPTQAFVEGQGYVPYQEGLTPSYQEQLERVRALGEQNPWMWTPWQKGESVGETVQGMGVTETPKTYKPRAETQLRKGVTDYVSGLLDMVSTPAYAAGEEVGGVTRDLSWDEMLQAQEATAGRSPATAISYEGLTSPEYFKQPMTPTESEHLPAVWQTAQQTGQDKVATQKIIQGVASGATTPANVGNLIDTSVADNQIMNFVSGLSKQNLPLPEISNERLNNIEDQDAMTDVWNAGYKAPVVVSFATSAVSNFTSQTGMPIFGAESAEKLQAIDYMSLMNVLHDLSGEGKYSMNDFARMVEAGNSFRLNTSYKGDDAFGNPLFSAYLETDVPYKPPEKTGDDVEYWENWETNVERYWDERQVENRAKQREESWEWSHNKDLEGWSEYYSTLDALKLPPFMNEWASSTTMFNELRRIWETTAKGQSWEQFLSGYDWWEKWFEQRPSERGEKPGTYAPVLTGVSQL